MNTVIDQPPASMNPAAQLWLITHGGWHVRADQVVALYAGRNHNPAEPRFAVTARVSYDPELIYTLAQFDEEDLARQSLSKLLEHMAGWDGGFGAAWISRHTGGVIISQSRSRPAADAEDADGTR